MQSGHTCPQLIANTSSIKRLAKEDVRWNPQICAALHFNIVTVESGGFQRDAPFACEVWIVPYSVGTRSTRKV